MTWMFTLFACAEPEAPDAPESTPVEERLEDCVVAVTTSGEEVDLAPSLEFGGPGDPARVVLDPSVSEVRFCAGTFHAAFEVASDVAFVGLYGAEYTTLSGGGVGRHLVVGEGLTVSVTDLTLSDGFHESEGGSVHLGRDSALLLERAVLADNVSGHEGGAVFVGRDGALDAVDSVFRDNAADTYGGAVKISGDATASFTGTRFENNQADSFGGAIHSWTDLVTLTDCAFSENSSGYAGGAAAGDAFDVTDSSFVGNHASDSGGALHIDGGTSNVSGSTFERNTAGDGAALYVSAVDRVVVFDSAFVENDAGFSGGAIYAYGAVDGSHVDFVDNVATDVDTFDGGEFDFGQDATFHCDRDGC